MKVFVAGGTGVLGRRAVAMLVAQGHDVAVVARSTTRAAAVSAAGARPIRVDLFDPVAVAAAVAGSTVVINMTTHIPRMSRAWRSSAWLENDELRRVVSRNLVDAALATGVQRYIQESVVALYADGAGAWIDETWPVSATTITESALVAEQQALRFTGAGRVGVVLRFGLLYAPDSQATLSTIRSAQRGFGTTFGRNDGYVSMIHADDAASAVVAALNVPAGIYNVVEDEPVTKTRQMDALATALRIRRLNSTGPAMAALGGSKTKALSRSVRATNRSFREASGWAPRYPGPNDGWAQIIADLGLGRP